MQVGYKDDPVGYEQRLNAKLQPDIIRGTLAFAGLYQVTHEMLKQAVLDKVREFYCLGLHAERSSTAEEREQLSTPRSVASVEPVSGVVAVARTEKRNNASPGRSA